MTFRTVLLVNAKTPWLLLSLIILSVIIAVGTILISILNTGYVNHLLVPIGNYLPIIKLIWQDSAINAVQFSATKSLFALAYLDPRSQLNLWTFEFDAISLLVYLLGSMYLAKTFITHFKHLTSKTLPYKIMGIGLLIFSVSYMSAIKHCAGPTWVGFVVAYGLGFTGFDHMPIWQILFALIGMVLIVLSHRYSAVVLQR